MKKKTIIDYIPLIDPNNKKEKRRKKFLYDPRFTFHKKKYNIFVKGEEKSKI